MKISEYIACLEAIKAGHGDLDVETTNHWGRITAAPPVVAWRKILKAREQKPGYFSALTDADYRRGEKVCRI